MTATSSHPSTDQDYIPGLGKHFLTPLYDLVHHVFGLAAVHQKMITLADLRPGHRVLDVGCGTGNLLRSTGKLHPGVDLVGLDPDPRALALATRKSRRANLHVQLDRGFAQSLPYADNSFDRVFSSLMLHHLDTPAKDAMLTDIHRVLRPTGLLVLADAVLTPHTHVRPRLRRRTGMRARMHHQIRDNTADAVAQRIAAAGFTVRPTHTMTMRIGGTVGIELAEPNQK